MNAEEREALRAELQSYLDIMNTRKLTPDEQAACKSAISRANKWLHPIDPKFLPRKDNSK